jgi:hypothetical protein
MSSWAETVRQVEARAGSRCEYCRMHQSLQGSTFHVEHITPSSQGGGSDLDNLAWSCPGCNLQKSNRTEVVDPEGGAKVRLFHPRRDPWSDHFRFEGYTVVGLTPIGRAAVAALEMNHPRRLLIRQAEEFFDLFPP